MSTGEFEGHEALIAQLQAGTLDAPGHLHRRVLSGGTVKRRRWADMSGRKRALLVVPIAATLAVGAAVVHSAFYNSGSQTAAPHAVKPLPGLHNSPGPSGGAGPTGPRGETGTGGATGFSGQTGTWSTTHEEKSLQGPARATAYGTPPVYYRASNDAAAKYGSARAAYTYYDGSGQLTAGDQLAFTSNADLATYQTQVNGSLLNMHPAAAQAVVRSALAIPKKRLVHADAVLGVVVANNDELADATSQATSLVTRLGGYAQSVKQGTNKNDGSSVLDLRVPVGKAEFAIQKLGSLGRLVSQQVSTQDLQQTFTKQTDVIGRLRREIAVYNKALESGSLSESQRINVQIELSNARYQLKSLLKSRSQTVSYGATADIQLTLSTDKNAFATPPSKRGHLGTLLHNAASFLALEAVIVLYALIVAGPILLILGLVWWLTRERRRREERALLASA